MRPSAGPVKRRYDNSRRREAATSARRRVVDAARASFLGCGYAATTVSAVAASAGVSAETVYKAFGGKPGLVKAVFDDGVAGPGAEPAPGRAVRISAEVRDPVERLRAFGRFVAEVTPRVAPLMLLVRAAAEHDEALGEVWRQMNEERLVSMARHAQRLAEEGHLRPDVSVDEARDVLWTYCAPELYDLLVQQRGWSPERFGSWVGDAYVAALLPAPT